MRLLLCALSAMMLGVPAAVEARTDIFTGGDTIFRSKPQEIDATAELRARRGAPLLTRTLIPLRSVVIEGDVSVRVNIGNWDISAGSILFAAGDAGRGIYCTPARGGNLWGYFIACLADTNGDGIFDRQGWGGAADALPHQQVHSPLEQGGIKPFGLAGSGTELISPVSYRPVTLDEGAEVNVDIVWQVRRIPNTSNHEVRIWTNGGKLGRDVGTREQTVILDNVTEQVVTIDGVRIVLLKMLDDRTLSYRVSGIDSSVNVTYPRLYHRTELTLYL